MTSQPWTATMTRPCNAETSDHTCRLDPIAHEYTREGQVIHRDGDATWPTPFHGPYDRTSMLVAMVDLGIPAAEADGFIDAILLPGEEIEFVVERRGFSAVDPRGALEEGWRFNLRHSVAGYVLVELVHEVAAA